MSEFESIGVGQLIGALAAAALGFTVMVLGLEMHRFIFGCDEGGRLEIGSKHVRLSARDERKAA